MYMHNLNMDTIHIQKRNKDVLSDSDINVENKDSRFFDSGIMPLDTPVKPEYDTENIMLLDPRVSRRSPKGDNSALSSCHSRASTRESRTKTNHTSTFRFAESGRIFSLSPSDSTPLTLSPSGLTRGSREKRIHCFLDTHVKHEYDKRIESGRSMVEMLGTLAIIGVLSIGGIMGYSYAVDKYHANQIMNDVNLRGIDLIAQASRNGDFSLAEWPTKTSADYDIGLEIDEATNTTEGGIYVYGVPKRICEIIADDLLPEDIKLVIDGEAYVSGTCGATNKMVFYYDAMAEALGGEEPECNGPVVDGVCQPCEVGSIWDEEENECLCPNGCPTSSPFLYTNEFFNNDVCISCPSDTIATGCQCTTGCPENYWIFISMGEINATSSCYPCPEGATSSGGRATECTCESGTFKGCWNGTSSCSVDSSSRPMCPPVPPF